MTSHGMPMLPPRWLTCPRMGDMILDIFVPFKTPLDSKFDHFMQPEHVFHVDSVFTAAEPYKLGLVIDLTKSVRFYQRREVADNNCRYIKIECKGNEETPTAEQVDLFIKVVNQFLDNNPGDLKVGVHCTHGFNRTGFMIVAYLVEELNYGVDIAVQIFAEARPPGIYKTDYLQELFQRYGSREDCPPAPALPDWCLERNADDVCQSSRKRSFDPNAEHDHSGTAKSTKYDGDLESAASITRIPHQSFPPPPKGVPSLMEGVPNVVTLEQDSVEAHVARDLADRLLKTGGCVYLDGQLVYADAQQSAESDSDNQDIVKPDRSAEATKRYKHSLYFRGSQPVSISQRNMELLINLEYCVSYKSDGSRYLLLITGPHQVYLIDRGNFVYKVEVLHFPSVSWVKSVEANEAHAKQSSQDFLSSSNGHLYNTLLDGEMVLCHNPSQPATSSVTEERTVGTCRFLIYDIVALNNKAIGRSPFFERYVAIDKQVIWPRNTAGHLGLVDFSLQSFSVRRKPFLPLNQTEELLKPEFSQRLDHITDGLIFQPCGPEDFYVLGTCPQTLKWKPPHLNTIDFRCKVVYESKVGEIPGYTGHLYLGGLNVPSAKLAHVGPKDKTLDGKIVECVVAPGIGWKVIRIRTDKTEPNYHKSGVAVIESIMFPVTVQHLLMCVRQRGIKLGKTQPASSSSNVTAK